MSDDQVKRGKTILSCCHEDEYGCWGVSVQFDEEQCVAGAGFVPTTIYAQYCHECATKLYYELGKDAGRVEAGLELDRIEALTAEVERLREALGKVRFLAQVNYEQNDNLNSRGRRDLWRIAECARAALGDTQ